MEHQLNSEKWSDETYLLCSFIHSLISPRNSQLNTWLRHILEYRVQSQTENSIQIDVNLLKVHKDIIFYRISYTMVKRWTVHWSLGEERIPDLRILPTWIEQGSGLGNITSLDETWCYIKVQAHTGSTQKAKKSVHGTASNQACEYSLTWSLRVLRHCSSKLGSNVHGADST